MLLNLQSLNHISELFLAQFVPLLVSALQRNFCASQLGDTARKSQPEPETRKVSHNLLVHSIANPSTQQITVLVPGINLPERKLKAFQELKWPDCIQTIELTHMRI